MLARRRRDERDGRFGLYGEGDQGSKGSQFLGELMQEASKRRRIGDVRPGQPGARPGQPAGAAPGGAGDQQAAVLAQQMQQAQSDAQEQIAQMHAKQKTDWGGLDRDEMDRNTPMWLALSDTKGACQVTIKEQHSIMFWLGYFIRKIMHDDNLERLKQINKDTLSTWANQMEIKHYYINEAKELKSLQE